MRLIYKITFNGFKNIGAGHKSQRHKGFASKDP